MYRPIDSSINTNCVVPEKNRYQPRGRSSEIPRGRVVLKAKILEAKKYEAKLEFLGGRGCKTKSLPWGEYGYFLELLIDQNLNLNRQKAKAQLNGYEAQQIPLLSFSLKCHCFNIH